MGLRTTAWSLTPLGVGVDPGSATHGGSTCPSIGPWMGHPGREMAAVPGNETDGGTEATWSGDPTGRSPRVNDTSALAEFHAKPGLGFPGLMIGAAGIIGFSHMSIRAAAIALGLLALPCLDFLYLRRNPLLSVYSSFLEVRPHGMWGRTRRISFAELGGWRQGSRLLCFETIASRKIFVSLRAFRGADRRRLIARLESLKLGQAGFPGPTKADFLRYQLKVYGAFSVVMIGLLLLNDLLGAFGIH